MRRVLLTVAALLLVSVDGWAQDFIRYYPPPGLGALSSSGTALTSSLPLILPDGTNTNHSLTWSTMGVASGFYSYGAGNYISLGWGPTNYHTWIAGRYQIANATADLQFYTDTSIARKASGTLALINSDSPNSQMTWQTYGGYSSYRAQGVSHELLTLSTAGATTDTTANLLPANSVIESVVVRTTTEITGAGVSSITVGDPTTAARFGTGLALAAGSTLTGLIHVDQTGAGGPIQATAAKVRLTAVGGTPTAGVVRVLVYYSTYVVPGT